MKQTKKYLHYINLKTIHWTALVTRSVKIIIFIGLSFFIASCYTAYQTTNQISHTNKENVSKETFHKERCQFREWLSNCIDDAHNLDDIASCLHVFKKSHDNIFIKYNQIIINPRTTPQHTNKEHLLISERFNECEEKSLQTDQLSGYKKCIITTNKDMMSLVGCESNTP